MTKQREEIAKVIYADWGVSKWENLMGAEKETWCKTADKVVHYLHSQGMVTDDIVEQSTGICPVCGCQVIPQDGRLVCPNCHWSKGG